MKQDGYLYLAKLLVPGVAILLALALLVGN